MDRANQGLPQSIEDLLEECKKSPQNSFDEMQNLLACLENPETQKKSRRFCVDLEKYFLEKSKKENFLEKYHFSLNRLAIDSSGKDQDSLLLLQLPSTFTPEEWSFTFYEGLRRYKTEDFSSHTIAELGCGNGWISLALAKKNTPKKIYGLDINPRAIVSARINLFLNALDDAGEIKLNDQGKSLFDCIEFHTSDLLEHCFQNQIMLDKVIGCIPQVCLPDSNLISDMIGENASDESLHALSNYCEKQGYIEDQFGLGLIARAVEESIELLKPNGRMIFNLGGRPGKHVLNRLFNRRGCTVQTIWQTKIEQAGDTDILPLVEIEKTSAHRFEFFMSLNSVESVSARTALAYAQHGGKIFHSLKVVEIGVSDLSSTKELLRHLKKSEYKQVSSALDLDYEESSLVEEKISFLSDFADRLNKNGCFPYNETNGDIEFRKCIADFLKLYFHIPITFNHIFVAPSRPDIIKNAFSNYGFKKGLIEREISKNLPHEWLQSDTKSQQTSSPIVLECPHHVEGIEKLIESFQPQVVVCSLSPHEMIGRHSFAQLIDCAYRNNTQVIVDLSLYLELSSTVKTNGVFEYLSERHLPQHVHLMCALIHSKLYKDLEVTFLLSENENLLVHLEKAAELTYSRAPFLAQKYYHSILFELLNFHMKSQKRETVLWHSSQENVQYPEQKKNLQLSSNSLHAFDHPAVKCSELSLDHNTVRLDYGENSLAAPTELKSCLLESLARQHISQKESYVEEELACHLSTRFGLEHIDPNDIFLAHGLSPFFAQIAQYASQHHIALVFPRGAYGHFVASSLFFGCQTIVVETNLDTGFKLTPEALKDAFEKNKNQNFFVFLNAPVVNPTGQIYGKHEIKQLFELAHSYNVTFICDTIFSGLEFEENDQISSYFNDIDPRIMREKFLLLGGVSKEFAAGGLRFGYAYTQNISLQNGILKKIPSKPPAVLNYTFKRFYSLLNGKDKNLEDHLKKQRLLLKHRAETLSQLLAESGWDPLPCYGGLFLIAKPKEILGQNAHLDLFEKTGLLVNDPQWTGIPGYCRFVLSVTDQEFEMALEKIRRFWSETH